MLRPGLAALALMTPCSVLAQAAEETRFVFGLGAGINAQPGYFGSDETTLGPNILFDFGALSLGSFAIGNPDFDAVREGWGLRGSFRYIGERSSEDYPELEGLEDVDRSIELGLGVSYTQPHWDAFAVARYGVIGHNTFVMDLGLDGILRPTERLTLRAGPRVSLGTDNYSSIYFGVTPAEAAASNGAFQAYEAEGGVLSAGAAVLMEYRLTPAWGIAGGLRYERFLGDAENSPITFEDDQLTVFAGVTRRFNIRF